MAKKYLILVLTLLPVLAFAQPGNDECAGAIELTDLNNWCSAVAEFSNEDATEGTVPPAFCFPNNQENNDVWFVFTASATNLTISLIGSTFFSPGGTLDDPQMAMYEGDCDNLVDFLCVTDAFNNDQVSLLASNLVIGQTYYLRVGARFGKTGTFQLCLNAYNQVPAPDSDCVTGVVLCDKSPFSVEFVSGNGVDATELFDQTCVDPSQCAQGLTQLQESSSAWYKWTCDVSGTLTFDITPLNPVDDIDFLLYELPNGIDDCTDKINLRCMFSGANTSQPLEEWIDCTGATGLQEGDTDDTENCGCQPGDNNYVVAANLESGKSYALIIMNYSESGSGFSIEFGGTSTFLGPTAEYDYSPDQICVGESVSFTDESTFIGVIESWRWDFGVNANPRFFVGQVPPPVVYSRPGFQSVVLEIETERGCIVTEVATVEVICCDDYFEVSADIMSVECPDTPTGSIDLTTGSTFAPITFEWSNGAMTEDIFNVIGGAYSVTLTDLSTCQDSFEFVVDGPPPFVFDTLITMPTCNGGQDGAITLNVSGATPPYTFSFEGGPFGASNTFSGLPIGDYAIIVRDANDCEFALTIEVRELELMLDPTVVAITQPSCFGFADGSILVAINNGLPPYQYDFNDGNGFQSSNVLTGLPAGTYQVDVQDANLCMGSFTFVIEDHPPLTLSFATQNISCFGESDGMVMSIVGGGVGNYTYQWANGPTTADLVDVPAGDYFLTVTDGNGCTISGDTTLTEPGPLFLDVIDVVDNICFGETNGSITVQETGGVGPFQYSTDGINFQDSPIFTDLLAGDYTLTVLDAQGCTAEAAATITEPDELIVDAGPDVIIDLGFDTTLIATSNYSPVTYEWSPADSLECLNADCSRILVFPVNTTTYQVVVTNEDGCQAIDLVTVRVVKNRPVYIPNVFSPNGDGSNDGFTLFTGPAALEIEQLEIYDRWGGLIYRGGPFVPNQPRLGWDGTRLGEPVNPGVFVYVAQVRFLDGEVVQFDGDVTVLR